MNIMENESLEELNYNETKEIKTVPLENSQEDLFNKSFLSK